MSQMTELFRHSPFEPLRLHMESVMGCVALIQPMLEKVRDADYDGLDALAKIIFKAEHDADLIKDEIRQTIPKSFFLPVYRGDLLGCLAVQDSMADAAEDLAVMLTIKNLHMPETLVEQIFKYREKITATCDKADDVSKALAKLPETGFTSPHVEKILDLVAATEKAEWDADRKQYELSKALFALEDQISAADLFLWFRAFGIMGETANHAEKSADRVRRMLAK